MNPRNRWLPLSMLVCLVCGWISYLPLASPALALASNPPPPAAEAAGFPPVVVQTTPPAPTAAQAELEAGLAALERAREQGPEAVLALAQTLRGAALDAAMPEIVAARGRVVSAAAPRLSTAPVSPVEEAAAVQAQAAREAALRERALSQEPDTGENQAPASPPQPQTRQPQAPVADLTVGSGCTYVTIGAAVAAANPGDRLQLEGGVTFNENVIVDRALTLQGGYSGCASGSSARTTVNGGASGPVIIITATLEVALINLDLTNGSTGLEGGGVRFAVGSGGGTLNLSNVHIYGNMGYWGGGLWVGTDAEVIGENVEIYDNTATDFGGGVRLYGGRATFSHSNIYANTAPRGAGVYATREDGVAPALTLPSYADIYDNDALTGDGFGGGVFMREGVVAIADCSDLYANSAIAGGGAYLITSTLTLESDCSEIMLNSAVSSGGGVFAADSTVNVKDSAEVYANSAGGSGGGVYLDNSSLWGDKALIHYNTAASFGGGVYATNGSLFAMDLGSYACIGPRCSQLSYNTADNVYGGGVYATLNSTVDLRQTFVEGNSANYGGGIYANASPVMLYNVLVAHNDATGGIGDGLRLYTGSSLTGAHNTFAHNDAAGASTGRAIDMYGSTLTLSNSIIWGHASSINDATQTVTCSDIQGGYAGADNLAIDPLFVAPASSDFHLQTTSPVIDRCATGQALDFDNEPRPIVRIRPATPYDMGADEFSAPRVGINGGGCAYGTLSQAIAAAGEGDTLQVAAGTFYEAVNIFDTALTVVGGYDSLCATPGAGATTLDAQYHSGSVIDIRRSVVTLRDLSMTGGDAIGGGVDADDDAHVILDNVRSTGNTGTYGAGLYIGGTAVVTLTNGSRIENNTATIAGGGARVWGALAVTSWSANITGNAAPDGGGLSVPGGVLALRAGQVRNNRATGPTGLGGGIHVHGGGSITVTGSSNIALNDAYDGGGIYADSAEVSLLAVVHSNTATNHGGGVYLTESALVGQPGTSIGYAADGWGGNEAVIGAGLYVASSTASFSGVIQNNIAADRGAGLYASDSVITLTGAHVGGAGAHQANQLGANGHIGAGLLLDSGAHATLVDTIVAGNVFQTTGFAYGGGAYVMGGSVLTLTDSTVEGHVAPSVNDGRGAGLYVNGGVVTLDNSQVLSNTAGAAGGGVRLFGSSTLNILNGSELRNNHALNRQGGALAAGGEAAINVSDAVLRQNTAGSDGGAIYLNAGTLNFTGGWTLRENTAGGSGGGVAVVGTATASFNAGGYVLAYFNRAQGGHGGMVYLGNDTTMRVRATAGSELYVYANHASENGGALYADNGGLFDIYGQVNFERNRAQNGGAIYVSTGSRVWLDDYLTSPPQLWDNWADNGSGGAIYAADSPRVECDGATFGKAGEGNQASVSGGAIYLVGSTLDADNCVFQDNRAVVHGGAVAAYDATLRIYATMPSVTAAAEATERSGLGIQAVLATPCDPRAQACSVFASNVADRDGVDTGDGGAIYNSDSTLEIQHTHLHRNSAARGGAIYQTGVSADAQIANSLVYSNTASLPFGAGIRRSGGAFDLTHVTLANNVGGAGFSGAATAATNTIAWGNSTGGFTMAPATVSCNIDDGGHAGVNVDPQFVAPGAGENYRLRGSSPARDACVTGLSPDLDNLPRPYGSAYDMGVYEYALAMALGPDRAGSSASPGFVTYTHTLTNTGGAVDTYTLSAQSSHGWNVTLAPTTPIVLHSGEQAAITVGLTIPGGVLSGTLDTLTLTAISAGDPGLSAQATATTRTFTDLRIYLPLTVRRYAP